jgi:hypothetical protein
MKNSNFIRGTLFLAGVVLFSCSSQTDADKYASRCIGATKQSASFKVDGTEVLVSDPDLTYSTSNSDVNNILTMKGADDSKLVFKFTGNDVKSFAVAGYYGGTFTDKYGKLYNVDTGSVVLNCLGSENSTKYMSGTFQATFTEVYSSGYPDALTISSGVFENVSSELD